jgi:hypothetical protein
LDAFGLEGVLKAFELGHGVFNGKGRPFNAGAAKAKAKASVLLLLLRGDVVLDAKASGSTTL